MKQIHRRIGFTLIELLTVIAIIGILAALLFPAIKTAILKAEINKAQTAIHGLGIAFNAYYTEYGKWPVADTTPANSNLTYIVDTNLVAILRSVDDTGSLSGPGEPPFGPTYNVHATSKLQGNPRRTPFLEIKAADLDGSGAYVDPWKRPYYCRFDQGYHNDVDNPFYTPDSDHKINAGFVIWSAGPDGQYDRGGEIPPSALNKDNVKSW